MVLAVVPYEEQLHREGAVRALSRLRAGGDRYPPDEDGVESLAELDAWLFGAPDLHRWVAVNGTDVVGHVCIGPANYYLADRLSLREPASGLSEIGKLFVAPDGRGTGAGRRLLETALRWAADQGTPAALAVLPTSQAAVELYRRVGMVEVGTFDGFHGVNLVFVDDPTAVAFSEPPR